MKRSTRNGSAALVVFVSLTLTACGSTVPIAEQRRASEGGTGLAPVSSAPDGNTGDTGGTTPGTSTGSGPGLAEDGGTGGGDSSSSGTPPSGPATGAADSSGAARTEPTNPLSGRGFTRDQVLIGVATASDSDTFTNSLGISGTGAGDVNGQMNAIVDDLNRHGGVLGRKVVLVRHDYSTTQAATNSTAANNSACVDWTQDHHVFAVIGPLIADDTLLSCLGKASTPLLELGGGVDYPLHYSDTYRKYPSFFNIDQMVGDRYDRIAVQRLVARSFFTPWNTLRGSPGTGPVTMGLLGYSDPAGGAQIDDEVRQLKAQGIGVAQGNIVRCPRDVSAAASCNANAVLRFSSNHVTHVWGAGLLFMNQAESQGYHPRYFVQNSARVLAENAPSGQLNGAMAESYIPSYDVETTEYPGDPSTATGRCRDIMKAGGVDISASSVLYNALLLCDGFFFFEAALKRSGSLGTDQLVRGLESLSSSQPSALTWTSLLSPSEHTTAHGLRDLTYEASSKRWHYASTRTYSG